MADHALKTILLSKLMEVEGAMLALQRMNQQQEMVKAQFPLAYSIDVHAASVSNHVQGAYTQAEGLLKQVLELTDGKIPKSETWHQDLIRLAGTKVPGVREALLDEQGMQSMRAALGFRHVVRSNYAGSLDPDRVFEQISNLEAATNAVAEGIRELLGAPRPESQPVERGG